MNSPKPLHPLPPSWIWPLAATAVAVAVYPSLHDSPISFDEALYHSVAREVQKWLQLAIADPGAALAREGVEAAFASNKQHPVFAKLVGALSNLLLQGKTDPLVALRAGNVVLAIACVLSAFGFIGRRYGSVGGIVAGCGILLIPSLYGGIGTLSMDFPMAALGLLATLAFILGLEHGWAAIAFGAILGLAFNTKINAAFTPIPLVVWAAIWHRAKAANNLFALIFVTPAVCILTWPWLWYDSADRLIEYLMFHLHHHPVATFYLGEFYRQDPAPWHYPWFYFVTSIPLGLLIALVVAPLSAAIEVVRRHPVDNVVVLLSLAMIVPVVSCSLPGVPKYDAHRLFMGAFPFAACLAGIGASRMVAVFEGWFAPASRRWVAGGLAAILLLPAAVSTWRVHPFEGYAYFNGLVTLAGGPRAIGVSPLHSAMADRSSVEYLNDSAADGDVLRHRTGAFAPVRAFGRAGVLRRRLRRGDNPKWVVLEFNHAYSAAWPHWWSFHDNRHPRFERVHEVRRGGEILIGVYRAREDSTNPADAGESDQEPARHRDSRFRLSDDKMSISR